MSGETVDLEAIEARAKAATGGRWEAYRVNRIAPLYGVGSGDVALTQDVGTWRDADFIAHARTDIPALIAEVRRLREALNEALFYITAGGPARMFGTREMYDCLIEKSRVDGWRAAVGGEPR